jgi:hypothetical protein
VEAALNRLTLLPAMLSPLGEVGVGSMKDMGVELYGCLSPRVGSSFLSLSAMPSMPSSIEGEAIAVVVALMLQIMPDLQEICASSSLPLSGEHVKMDSLVTLCSRDPSDVISAPIPPTSALSPDALFAKDLCDVLSKLEAAIPRYGRAIACLLTGLAIKSKGKTVGDCPGPAPRRRSFLGAKARGMMPLERCPRLLDGQSSVSRCVLLVWAILGCGVALCILLRCSLRGVCCVVHVLRVLVVVC